MANEQSGNPLRLRWWRPFYEATEAAGHPRAAFRDTRVRIVELLRAATYDGAAEQLCAALDDAMAEAFETLRVGVVPVPHSALASTNLARTVGAIGKRGPVRIQSLAGDVVRGWTTANVVARATAVKEIDTLSGDPIPSVVPATAATEEQEFLSKENEEQE